MQRFKQKKQIFLILGILNLLTITTFKVNAGTFGAEIFCTMRDGGNDHESSWEAAYSYIKKQKGGIFKVSPKQAASQITESVIREKENFSYCVEYLDKLHPNRKLLRELQKEKEKEKELEFEEATEDFSEETIDRYSY
ncbi:secretion system protein [bacterium]|nr:secretion system protein [bacterium]